MRTMTVPVPRVPLSRAAALLGGIAALLVFGESVLPILAAVAAMLALRSAWTGDRLPVVRALTFQATGFAGAVLTLVISPSCAQGAMWLMLGMIFSATILSRTAR